MHSKLGRPPRTDSPRPLCVRLPISVVSRLRARADADCRSVTMTATLAIESADPEEAALRPFPAAPSTATLYLGLSGRAADAVDAVAAATRRSRAGAIALLLDAGLP